MTGSLLLHGEHTLVTGTCWPQPHSPKDPSSGRWTSGFDVPMVRRRLTSTATSTCSWSATLVQGSPTSNFTDALSGHFE
ncbi:MAG: hypothetical protein ACJAQ3_001240 [Planctomycetota bacterium]|jgi:hypothetical protein